MMKENEINNDLMKRALAATENGIIITDASGPDNPIIYCNAAFEKITGYTAHEAHGHNCRFLQGPETEKEAIVQIRQALKKQQPCRVVLKNLHKNKTPYWNDLTISPIFNREGVLTHYVGIQHVVTDKVMAEAALRENNRLLTYLSVTKSKLIDHDEIQSIFTNLLNEILNFTGSEYGFIGEVYYHKDGTPYLKTHAITNIAWNDATRKFFDDNYKYGLEFNTLKSLYGEVLLSGQPLISNQPSQDPKRHGIPEGHPALNAFLGLPLVSGSKLIGMVGLANRPGGYDEAITTLLIPFMTACANGIEAYRNLLDKQAAESALRENEAFIRQLHMVTSDVTLDFDSKIQQLLEIVSQSLGMDLGIFSRIEDDLYQVRDVFTPEKLIQKGQIFSLRGTYCEKTFSTERPVYFDQAGGTEWESHPAYRSFHLESYLGVCVFQGSRKYGTLNFSSFKPRLRPFSEPEITWIQMVAQWISKELDAQASQESIRKTLLELERSNKDLEQFAYMVSHDLQEPLRMVTSYVQLLKKRYENNLDQNANEFINFAVDGAKRMQTLIMDLLEYSRIGTRGKEMFPVSSETALQKALRSLHLRIEENQVEVTYTYMPMVLADESQLFQLFQNLIGNAIKFRQNERQRIRIRAERDDKYWKFSVKDDGIGIEPQYFDKVFMVFQRLFDQEEYPGTGIGLAICKKIVERHQGAIWLNSKVGKGTTFYFTLLAADPGTGIKESPVNENYRSDNEERNRFHE